MIKNIYAVLCIASIQLVLFTCLHFVINYLDDDFFLESSSVIDNHDYDRVMDLINYMDSHLSLNYDNNDYEDDSLPEYDEESEGDDEEEEEEQETDDVDDYGDSGISLLKLIRGY